MERSGSLVKLKLRETKKNAHFWRGIGTGLSREREGRKSPPSLYDLQRSSSQNPSSQDLKFIYSTRATRGYRQHAVSPKISGLEKKYSERSSTFSLRSTMIGGSASIGPRLKVEVLVEGNVWTQKSRIFVKDSSGSSGRLWVTGLRDSKKFRLRSKR